MYANRYTRLTVHTRAAALVYICLIGSCLIGPGLALAAPALKAPASAAAGAQIEIQVSGNSSERDLITIVPKGAREGSYEDFQYAQPGKVKLNAPATPGNYEIRLLAADSPFRTLARLPLRAAVLSATLEAPAQAGAGSAIQVKWHGPNNDRDYIAIGSADQPFLVYEYTRNANPVTLEVPDIPGEYELRYFLGAGDKVIGSSKITIAPVSASVQAPAQAVAGATINVAWQGPNNPHDYITIVPKGTPEGQWLHYSYSEAGSPAKLIAPLDPGEYEVWYATGQTHATLARTSIRVSPSKERPGNLQVSVIDAVSAARAVEIIVDASDSMLQKIGERRRIDVAKQVLAKLASTTIPAGTPFALRVSGRDVDSCQTDLDVPLRPFDVASVADTINALEAKKNAKAPLSASLSEVAHDLASVRGERLVVVLTDGTETCGGDPAAAIAALRNSGVRVNIVGFAIDDDERAGTFRYWADLGNGSYFDARDAAGLSKALAQSLRSGFEVVNGNGQVVANGITGNMLNVLPGTYTVRLKGQDSRAQRVTIRPNGTATVLL